jgi:hypothetical protein
VGNGTLLRDVMERAHPLSRDVTRANVKWAYVVTFQVLTAAGMNMAVFWVVAPCSLVEVYRRFRDTSCLCFRAKVNKLTTRQQGKIQPSFRST